jgi:hypothetical protein
LISAQNKRRFIVYSQFNWDKSRDKAANVLLLGGPLTGESLCFGICPLRAPNSIVINHLAKDAMQMLAQNLMILALHREALITLKQPTNICNKIEPLKHSQNLLK